MGVTMSDVADFSIQLQSYISQIKKGVNDTVYTTLCEMCDDIIMGTPLDTTRPDDIVARGDWNSALGEEPEDVNNGDKTGESAKSKLRSVLAHWDVVEGQIFYFANYKPYIRLLEYGGYPHNSDNSDSRTTADGHSTQAPSGMLILNSMRFGEIFDEVISR